MATHQPHPKCGGCSRALYKSMEVGSKVGPADEFQFCRNPSCVQWGYRPDDAAEPAPEQALPDPSPPDAEPAPRRGKRRAGAGNAVASAPEKPAEPPPPAEEGEPISIHVARGRIRAIIAKLIQDHADTPPAAMGLVLAIVNQEMGCQAGANALIDELDLGRFGIMKFGV